MNAGGAKKLQTGIVTVDFVIVNSLDTALLNQKCAVHAGRVRNENTRSVTGISVVGQFADCIEFSVLNFRSRDQFSIDFVFAAIVVTGRHAIPTETDD